MEKNGRNEASGDLSLSLYSGLRVAIRCRFKLVLNQVVEKGDVSGAGVRAVARIGNKQLHTYSPFFQ